MWGQVYGDRETEEVNHIDVIIVGGEIKEQQVDMAKKTTKKEETLNLDNILFKCRDILRQAKNSGSFFEKRDMMLTLVFLRFMGEKYEEGVASLRQRLIEEGLDPDNEEIIKAFFDDATFADGTPICR